MSGVEIKNPIMTKFLSSFTTIGLLATIAFLLIAIFGLTSHLEHLMPAEFQILLHILKNRFFR